MTVIPKTPAPLSPGDCRNISCTNFLSKVYESFVLEWCREEVKPKLNQYGGEPGASAAHLLVEVMDDVTSALEDNRSAVILSAVDFSKAFNRLEHKHCLESFRKKGASSDVIELLASFLSGRQMTVRIGKVSSDLLPVNAGAPQGSVLGCYLFNVGVDDLEEDFREDETIQEEANIETLGRTDDYPAVSTPIRVGGHMEDLTVSPMQRSQDPSTFRILPRVANVPPWIHKPKDPRFKTGKPATYKFCLLYTSPSPRDRQKSRMPSSA